MPEPAPAVDPALKRRLRRIRLVVCDVDGVLTDGGLYTAPDGAVIKRFDVHDGLGVVELIRREVIVVWLSGDGSTATAARAQKLGVRDLRQDVQDKAAALDAVSRDHGVSPDDMLYVGDDLTDLEPMKKSGIAVAVASAVAEVRAAAHWTTRLPGGYGAFREVADLVLSVR
jgi:3-deoxy-D-manno-octulosonate 8-phosphate phosphatase (KDO 8-P phosphatase)